MLALKNIHLNVNGEVYLDNINVKMGAGRLNLLLGATLSGKTSLMRVIAGLEKPSAGDVYLNDVNITAAAVQKRRVAMVYQQFINYPTMTVFENIASPLRAARATATEIKRRVQTMAELLKLAPFLSRRPAALSGGQQQRVALARALIKDADIILLDEPLANLDYKLREELREELPRLFAGREAVVIYATSDPAEALLLGGAVTVLRRGSVAQSGEASTVYHFPNSVAVAEIFSDPPLNTAPAIKRGDYLRLATDGGDGMEIRLPTDLQTLADDDYYIAFRAHHLLEKKSVDDAIPINGIVQIAEITGSESFVHLRVGSHNWVMQTDAIKRWAPADAINCYLSPTQLMIFDKTKQRVRRDEERGESGGN